MCRRERFLDHERRAEIIASFLDVGEIDEFDVREVPAFVGERIPSIRAAASGDGAAADLFYRV